MEHLTLNELLDKDTQDAREQTRSFESFKDAHSVYGQNAYNVAPRTFDMRADAAPRDDSYAPYSYQMNYNRPQSYQNYSAPQNDYRPQGYYNAYSQQNYDMGGYAQPYAPTGQNQGETLYSYAATEQATRMSEFEGRLAPQNNYGYQQRHRVEQERYDEQVAQANPGKMRAKKLDKKGKIIIGLYLAVVAAVITLIAVNAGRINSGKAVIPSSKVTDVAAEQTAGNISELNTINSLYDFRK